MITPQEAIEYLKSVGYQASAFNPFEPYYEDGSDYKEAVDILIKYIEETKNKNVVHSKWICSICQNCNGDYMDYTSAYSEFNDYWGEPDFCPHCGAIMDLDKKPDDMPY